MIGRSIFGVVVMTAAAAPAAIGLVISCFGSAGNSYGRGVPGSDPAGYIYSYPPTNPAQLLPAGDCLAF